MDVSCVQLWALAVLYFYLPFAIIFTNYRVITALILCKIMGTLSRREFNAWNASHFWWPLAFWMPVSDRLTFSVTSDHMGDLWALDDLWPFSNFLSPFWPCSHLGSCKGICPLWPWMTSELWGWPLISEWPLVCFLLGFCEHVQLLHQGQGLDYKNITNA